MYLDDPETLLTAIRFWNYYSEHQYPDSGTWFDQANIYLETMELMDSAWESGTKEKEKLPKSS